MSESFQPIDRPSPTLAGPGIAAAARGTFLVTRSAFFVASVMPVLIGTLWAGAALHRFNGRLLGISLGATVLAHAATSVYNDVSDDSRTQKTWLALGLAAGALLLGGWLAILRGPGVILLGAAGIGLGLLCSLPGVRLSARGTSKAAVAIGCGILPVLGAVWLQAGFIDSGAVLICLPLSAWAAALLVINEVPEIEADRRAGKLTLAVRWGARGASGARRIYGSLTTVALAAAGLAIATGALPLWYAPAACGLAILGFWALRGMSTRSSRRARLKESIELTLLIQALGCIFMSIAILTMKFG
jgi:1,4-dihydroxy-2-naphthoate octaprenyltransferase